MLLYELFLEMDARHFSSSYHEAWLTRAELDLALKKAIACYRTFQNPDQAKAYRHFLDYCNHRMQSHEKKPLLPLLLGTLLDEHTPLQPQIASDLVTQLFYLTTQHQHDARGLAPMGEYFIDHPVAFASFLRCLTRHGLSAHEILSTHLLHHFFLYHLNVLGQEQNPIQTLFQLLSACDETIKLAQSAKMITANERGFSSFALHGQITNPPPTTIEKAPFEVNFTAHMKNLEGLHALFGHEFLFAGLLQWHKKRNHTLWRDFFIILFNREDIISTQLPDLLSRLYDHPSLQQALSEILDKKTLGQLIVQRNPNILCLIPFCPELVGMIAEENLSAFLNHIRERTSSSIPLIVGLLNLGEALKNAHPDIKLLVFKHLLRAVLEEPCVLEDDLLLRKIRLFSLSNSCIAQHIKAYENELTTLIDTQAQGDMGSFDYISIEDLWRHSAIKIRNLQEILNLESSYPHDKWALYLRLAHALFKYHPHDITLEATLAALHVTLQFDKNTVTECERLVIELLAAIDNDAFRVECASLLDKEANRHWRKHDYGDLDCYQRGIQSGNIGYLEWLQAQGIAPSSSYDLLIIFAARHHQWPIAAHLFKGHIFKLTTVNLLLHTAVHQGDGFAIDLLWKKGGQRPSINQIEQTLFSAVKNGHAQAIDHMIYNFKMPPDKVMTKAFVLAINFKHYNIAKLLIENFKGKLLLNAAEDAMLTASRKGNIDLLNTLIPFSCTQMIETAFLAAARASQLETVRCFFERKTFTPRATVIQRAWNEAKKHQRQEISAYLSHFMLDDRASPRSPARRKAQRDRDFVALEQPTLRRATSLESDTPWHSVHNENRLFSKSLEHASGKSRPITHSLSCVKF